MSKNAYIHIPFCRGKCNYCSFVSFDKLELKDAYIGALKRQIKAEYKSKKLNTLYFGGGTPSLPTIDELDSLIGLFNFENDAEITIEANPESIDDGYLKKLNKIGINRLSIGAQTFDNSILNIIGRRHNAKQIEYTVNSAKRAGFKNISLDLIYGLPMQGVNEFEIDLKKIVDLDVQHVSLYGLKIEEGCYFHKNMPQSLPDLDLQADMYLKAVEMLKSASFGHYEISNFAKPGFESKHNLNYWNNNSYYGFGCSASGYIIPSSHPFPLRYAAVQSKLLHFNKEIAGNLASPLEGEGTRTFIAKKHIRYTNEPNLEKYIENPCLKISEQKLSKQEILEEAVFLGFRKTAGINIGEINQRFDINFNEKYAKILNKYSDYFIKTEKGYALTLEGFLISNEILSEFIVC